MTSLWSSATCAAPDRGGVLTELPALGSRFSLAGSPPPDLTPAQASAREAILYRDRPEEYETVPCPCGSKAGDQLLAEVDRHGIPSRNVVCLGCGLIRLTPRWREDRYRRFYESEYRTLYNRSLSPKAKYAGEIAAAPSTGERAAWIEQEARHQGIPANPRVVEIGAGAGWNLARLPSGWTRIGYDVDGEFLDIGRGSFRLDLRHGFVEEALAEVAAADLVLLSHVVEHLSHPSGVLETIRGRLRQGALLLIEVPGVFRIHRTNLDVRSYLQNAHTFTYCAATLGDSCRRAGLEVLGLNETARAVCRRGGKREGSFRVREGLPQRIIRYLKLCDSGYRGYDRLRRLPGVGGAAAALWKRTYYASLGLLIPPVQAPR
jgi:SAM-dependent methyltransferase